MLLITVVIVLVVVGALLCLFSGFIPVEIEIKGILSGVFPI